MVKLQCSCLNVCVEAVGSSFREVEGRSFLSETSTDDFFSGTLHEVQLGVGGIQKQLEILIKPRYIEDWVVFKCLGCNTEPFALHSHKGQERVLVNKNIESDPKKISQLIESESHSPAFKIILSSASEEEADFGNSYSNDSISTAAMRVQEHVRRYLKCEEEAMEERIRCYVEKQRKLFAAVQTQAYNDKRAMLSILRKAAETKVEECLSDAMADILEAPSVRIAGKQTIQSHADFPLENVANICIVQASASPSLPNKDDSMADQDGDRFDPIFPVDEDCAPFVDSDEEISSDNSYNQMDEYDGARYSNKPRYSSSVPVNVPVGASAKHRRNKRLFDEEDSEEVPTPDKMAESIKALARSVHDSREIFGELPRPRINTLPVRFR